MPVTASFYNSYKKAVLDSSAPNLGADTIKVALLANTYVPDVDLHANFSDVSAHQIAGTGYVAGGATLAAPTVTQDNVNNKAVFDANDVTWANSTITARYAVIYKDTGVAASSPLILVYDFGADKISSASDFIIQFNAAGIINAQ